MPVPPDSRPQHRIAKLLARAGVASRREIERMIAEGRVSLDGKVLETPATLLTSLHGVTVDGNPVAQPEAARLFRFHKPKGVLTTERDPRGRPTIYDRMPRGLPRLVPVGRLDLNTEGLLLLTTDGGLKRQLELPATGVERTYRARAYGQVSQAQLEDLIEGIEIDGVRYGPIDANLERRTGANVWVEMKLREGKNREVRRVLEHLGLEVSRLIRTSYGPFPLADLPVGAVEEVRQHDLVAFMKAMKLGGPLPTAPRQPAPPREERRPAPMSRRPERHAETPRAAHPGKPPRSAPAPGAKPARTERPPRAEKPGKPQRAGQSSRTELSTRSELSPKPGRPQRPGGRPGRRPPSRPGSAPKRRG